MAHLNPGQIADVGDTFTHTDGVIYIAIATPLPCKTHPCEHCAFHLPDGSQDCYELPDCVPSDIIWCGFKTRNNQ